MPGITIGKKSIIGAGSIVTRSVPDYCVAVGNPARVVKTFDLLRTSGRVHKYRSEKMKCA